MFTDGHLILQIRSVKDVDEAIVELNAAEANIMSKNQCYTQKMNEISAEVEELSTISNESSVTDLAEKYRWVKSQTKCACRNNVSHPFRQLKNNFLFFFFCRDETKTLTERNNKIKEFRNQIENTLAKRHELIESSQTAEAQLLRKRNDLNSILERSQAKTLAMERYATFERRRTSVFTISNFGCFFFCLPNTRSEHKRAVICNRNFETKLALAEQQVDDSKLIQKHLITMGMKVVEHIENFREWK